MIRAALRIARLAILSLPLLAIQTPRAEPGGAGELRSLRSRINAAEAQRKQAQTEAGTASMELRRHELALAAAAKRLRDFNQQVETKSAQLKELTRRKAEREAALARHREALAAQLRAAYAIGRDDTLKLMLNQEDPQRLGRVLVYHDYVNQARLARIAAVNANLREINDFTRAIRLETDKLRQLQAQQQENVRAIDESRAARRDAVARLQAQISTQDKQLQEMRADARRLARLIESLPAAAPPGGGANPDNTAFGRLKGRLSWPARGRIAKSFGDSRGDSELTSHGVFIEAATGADVHAVGSGRVVFADWFQSLGLLLIIDHGDGYMSLYGHNQSVQKAVGDSVSGGEVIASIGDSGGISSSGLYFEIRRNGVPQDPAQWCR